MKTFVIKTITRAYEFKIEAEKAIFNATANPPHTILVNGDNRIVAVINMADVHYVSEQGSVKESA